MVLYHEIMDNLGQRASFSLSFYLLVSLFAIFHPVLGENSSSTNNTNNTLFSRTSNQTKLDFASCVWEEVRPTYSIIAAIISGSLIVGGGILCALGYRQQRTSYGLLGFAVAGLVGYAIVDYKFEYSMGIQLLITAAMALFVAIISSCVLFCGMFLTGLCTGFCIGCIILVVISELHSFGSFAEPILILLGLSIAFACITLWWKRYFIILGTSVTGGAFIMGGLDYFVEGFLFTEYIKHIIYGQDFRKLCYFSWIVFAMFPVMALAGVTVQYFKTAKLKKRPTSISHQELAMNRLSASSHQSRV